MGTPGEEEDPDLQNGSTAGLHQCTDLDRTFPPATLTALRPEKKQREHWKQTAVRPVKSTHPEWLG